MISASSGLRSFRRQRAERLGRLQRLAQIDQLRCALIAGQVRLAAVIVGADPRQGRGVLAVVGRIGVVRLDAPPKIGDQRAELHHQLRPQRHVDHVHVQAAVAERHRRRARPLAGRQRRLDGCLDGDPQRDLDLTVGVPPAALERPLADRLQLDDADARDVGPGGERVRRRAEPHLTVTVIERMRRDHPVGLFLLQELERDRLEQPSAPHRRRLVSVIGQQAALQRPQTVRRHVRMNLGAEQGGGDRRRHILLPPLEPAGAVSDRKPFDVRHRPAPSI